MIFYTFDHLASAVPLRPLDKLSARLVEISHM
jgi:hypothetical protein